MRGNAVRLRKMVWGEFEAFAAYSAADYTRDLMQNRSMSFEEASREARREFSEMLPDGPDTRENALMVIEDLADGRAVGAIWFFYEVAGGVRHAFLSDFVIRPEERRKGYASAALAEMERIACANGCGECRLYVWNGNDSGKGLYAKCGYAAFRREADGLYMKKKLI